MEVGRALLVVGITLLVVVLVNVGIYLSVMRRGKGQKNSTVGQIELLRRASKRARNPWEDEDNRLEELSRKVAGLRRLKRTELDDQPAGNEDER
jgi:hypothetical protein